MYLFNDKIFIKFIDYTCSWKYGTYMGGPIMQIIKLGYYHDAFTNEEINSLFLDIESCFNDMNYSGSQIVCHYFPKSALLSIIKDKKFYFSDSDFLNDYSEAQQFYSIIEKVSNTKDEDSAALKIFKEILRIKPMIKNEISFSSPGVEPDEDEGFLYNRRNYIFCCSTDDDCLSNWKYYGKGSGYEAYNIAFDSNRYFTYINKNFGFKGCKCFAGRVIYDDEVKMQFMHELINRIDNFISKQKYNKDIIHALTTRLFYYMMDISLFFKDSAYKDEKEFRFVISLDNSKIKSSAMEYDFRFANDILIPFLKIPFDKEMIEFVGIGPCMDAESSSKSLYALLQYYEYSNTAVAASTIPLRY